MPLSLRAISVSTAAALLLAGCSNASAPAPALPQRAAFARTEMRPHSGDPIQHIVVMVQENRSFDNFFATYPGADGATTGKLHNGKVIQLKEQTLAALDINHTYKTYLLDYDNGNMDGFDRSNIGPVKAGKYPYQYVNPSQIQPYWTLASQYVLADHLFQTQGSGSFTAHQDLIAGGTAIDPTDSLVDSPSSSEFWGCDAPSGTLTSLLTTSGQYLYLGGPRPCITYPTGTLRDLLDAAHVSWKYYVPLHKGGGIAGALWNAFDVIPVVRYGPEWVNNVTMPETRIFKDIANGNLPALAWVIPSQQDSDHPHKLNGIYTGPAWVASVVNAIGQSPYWNSTAIVILWDDWGGFYDHVPPAFLDDAGGLGFRVPMIVVSPYVPVGRVDHTQYEFGSVLKFVEETFNLGSLGTTDVRATSIGGMFNFTRPPRTFTVIGSDRSRTYFLRRPPDEAPVDSQ